MNDRNSAESPAAPIQNPPAVLVQNSSIHGKGVFATAFIARDSVIGVYSGPRVQEDGTYVLWIDCELEGIYGIDGQNDLRFTNHSAVPNAIFEGAELIALTDIAAGEEVTFHYGEEWEDHDDIPENPMDEYVPATPQS